MGKITKLLTCCDVIRSRQSSLNSSTSFYLDVVKLLSLLIFFIETLLNYSRSEWGDYQVSYLKLLSILPKSTFFNLRSPCCYISFVYMYLYSVLILWMKNDLSVMGLRDIQELLKEQLWNITALKYISCIATVKPFFWNFSVLIMSVS